MLVNYNDIVKKYLDIDNYYRDNLFEFYRDKYYNSSFESLEDDYILKKHSIEYMYLSVPVNVGYKLLDKKGFTVTPYFGVAMKFNLRFVEKNQIDSNSWLDSYINVFDSNLYESDAKRILTNMM